MAMNSPLPVKRSARRNGFTLIELMVALAIGLMVVVAVLIVQLRLSQQNVRMSDTGARDNEVRAAVDWITRDVASSGFLINGMHKSCDLTLYYNSGAPGTNYFSATRVVSLPASTTTSLPFLDASSVPAIVMTYPAAGSVNRSDILGIRSITSTALFSDTATQTVSAAVNAAVLPMTTGTLPLASTITFKVNDRALVQVPVGPVGTQQRVCMRVPVTAVNATTTIDSGGALMPANFYTGFSAQLTNYGITPEVLSNSLLQIAKVTNMGPANASNQRTYAYFVDQPSAGTWPRLTRITLNSLTDTEVPNSRQDIASGVVSFQIMFGVDPAGTGDVTAYQTGPQVTTANNARFIRSMKFLLITRSLYMDPGTAPVTGTESANLPTTLGVRAQFSENGYTDYVVAPTDRKYRFVAQQSELVIRNTLWADN